MRSLLLALAVALILAWCLSGVSKVDGPTLQSDATEGEAQDSTSSKLRRATSGEQSPSLEVAPNALEPERERAVANLQPTAQDVAGMLLSFSESERQMVGAARRDGLLSDADLVLLMDREARQQFLRAWTETTQIVAGAEAARNALFKAYSAEEFKAGRCSEVLLDEAERTADGGFKMDRFFKKTHPDEYCATQMLYRDGGGQIIRQVRVLPGQVGELDEATFELRLAEEMRREAVSAVLMSHRNRSR